MSIGLFGNIAGFIVVVVGGLIYWNWVYEPKTWWKGGNCFFCVKKGTKKTIRTEKTPLVTDGSVNMIADDGSFLSIPNLLKVTCVSCGRSHRAIE